MPDDDPCHQAFSLNRRRESVTAVEVIAKLREVPHSESVIQMIETLIAVICQTGNKVK